ncbi:hypothetical protein FQN60_004203 [Etheostoma spectabile]|uniref:Uncharacterized protein n=1 Tax=Etheostoma spectabile TaxID=54343 RepID=A0A5J5CWH9_9PERO|nr:hypothetical protein FQN60_004203 [Etheostoma spectabile]
MSTELSEESSEYELSGLGELRGRGRSWGQGLHNVPHTVLDERTAQERLLSGGQEENDIRAAVTLLSSAAFGGRVAGRVGPVESRMPQVAMNSVMEDEALDLNGELISVLQLGGSLWYHSGFFARCKNAGGVTPEAAAVLMLLMDDPGPDSAGGRKTLSPQTSRVAGYYWIGCTCETLTLCADCRSSLRDVISCFRHCTSDSFTRRLHPRVNEEKTYLHFIHIHSLTVWQGALLRQRTKSGDLCCQVLVFLLTLTQSLPLSIQSLDKVYVLQTLQRELLGQNLELPLETLDFLLVSTLQLLHNL